MKHFSHQHHLVLKAGEPKPDGDIGVCDGCSVQISGPFYSCGDCTYYLHKVCAELPIEINHPVHPQHPLTLFSKPPYQPLSYGCDMCHQDGERFVYNCSICSFDLDPICASSSLKFEDKCHDHPLTVLNNLTLCCHICRTEEKGLSYKCSICPFEVHQGCTVSLRPTIVNQIQHPHPLTLLQSMPPEHKFVKKCDICHDRLYAFQCLYFCSSCMFFAHISCATPEEEPQSPKTGNQISEAVGNDGPSLAYLPVHPKSTDLISWFANNYGDRDAITNLILGFDESYIDRDTNTEKEINFFHHEHPLVLMDDDQVSGKICEACVLPISTPYHGCFHCCYFLHKYCTELPKSILHPFNPQRQISLADEGLFTCSCCDQFCNGFSYRDPQLDNICIDLKCASLLRLVKHEGHKHPLIPRLISSSACSACGNEAEYILRCATCSFNLCFNCAMAPSIMEHRYNPQPFILRYSPLDVPPERRYRSKCDLCETGLHPKHWFYHGDLDDQFAHVECMLYSGADSNINYKTKYKFIDHEHSVDVASFTRSRSLCKKCCFPMRTGYSVGFECKTCNFNIHLLCAYGRPASIHN